MRKFVSRNPYTGKILKEFDFLTNSQLDEKISKAGEAVKFMNGQSQTEKARHLEAIANVMEKNINKYA
jgi:acyl-CoA reductase-like NAD-dependent aldehyde dehydrogenase